MLTIDEAADVYRGHVARILIQGSQSERLALLQARRAAANAGLRPSMSRLDGRPRRRGGALCPRLRARG